MELKQEKHFEPVVLTLETKGEAKALFKIAEEYLENRPDDRHGDAAVVELCLLLATFGGNHVRY